MRIDGANLAAVKSELLELMKNLEVGDVLKGRVLEALGNSITLRTAGGQVLTAVLREGADIPKGAFIELIVSGIVDGKIFAEFKNDNKAAGVDEKVAALLKQFGLPVDEKNMEAARLLIKYGQPLEKESIVKLTGLQKSIDNLGQNSEGRLGLLLSGLDIKNTGIDVLNKLVLSWSEDMVRQDAGTNAPAEQAGSAVPKDDSIVPEKSMTNGDNTVEEQKPIKADNYGSGKDADIKAGAGAAEKLQAAAKGDGKAVEEGRGALLLKALDRLGIEAGSEVRSFALQVEDILSSISGNNMEALAYLASKEMKITPKNLGMLIKNIENSDGISGFLDKLQEKADMEDNPELKEIKTAIRKIFLEPERLEDGREVSEQLKDVARLGERLEKYLNDRGIKAPEIREALSNLRDSIDFLREINQHTNYLQIPVMINNDTATAKLYVFKEGKRNKRIDPSDATVVVALDLNNLGHLESMIKVKGKTVNVTFRVENKSIGAFLEKHSLLLKNSLKEKGYSLNPVRVINLEQPFSLLSMEAMINEGGTDKIHFDMRV